MFWLGFTDVIRPYIDILNGVRCCSI